jgi:DNA-binding MarR family transcriptional regulator
VAEDRREQRQERDRRELVEERLDGVDEVGHTHILAAGRIPSARMAAPRVIESPTAAEAATVAEFRVALRRFLRQTEIVARECGITPSWYMLLLQIKGAPDLSEQTTVTALAQRLQLAQSSVTELVARAVKAGLIVRSPSRDDARVVHLRLSAKGEEVFARAFRSLTAEREALQAAVADLDTA